MHSPSLWNLKSEPYEILTVYTSQFILDWGGGGINYSQILFRFRPVHFGIFYLLLFSVLLFWFTSRWWSNKCSTNKVFQTVPPTMR